MRYRFMLVCEAEGSDIAEARDEAIGLLDKAAHEIAEKNKAKLIYWTHDVGLQYQCLKTEEVSFEAMRG